MHIRIHTYHYSPNSVFSSINVKFIFVKIVTLVLLTIPNLTFANAPYLHFKTGISNINVNAGDRLTNVPLKPAITLKPTVLWDFPTFSSRIGVHFLQELKSSYGLTPISGIGLSAYYYLNGITTNYFFTDDDILQQRSRPGPYLAASLTPVNLNINQFSEATPLTNFYFSSQVNEVALSMGYDYPYKQNMIFSGEFNYRTGTNASSNKEQVNYTGYTIFFGFGTSYY
jgi:hypothetical protein